MLKEMNSDPIFLMETISFSRWGNIILSTLYIFTCLMGQSTTSNTGDRSGFIFISLLTGGGRGRW